MGISSETVLFHFSRIGDVLKALHWVTHILANDLKFIRLEMCQAMLAALRMQEHNQWHDIGTGDESSFSFECVRDRLWISCLDNTPDYKNRQLRWRNIG
jgi:hypothetical protein